MVKNQVKQQNQVPEQKVQEKGLIKYHKNYRRTENYINNIGSEKNKEKSNNGEDQTKTDKIGNESEEQNETKTNT